MKTNFDAIIIGGGFYGSVIAAYLKKNAKSVLLIEKESDIIMRASFNNQTRVHNGYHYPRSFLTATRSHANFNKFTNDFKECIDKSLTNYYVLPKNNNKITVQQFVQFCKNTEIPLKTVGQKEKRLFNVNLIDEIYSVEEYVFNPKILRKIIRKRLDDLKVAVYLNTTVSRVQKYKDSLLVETSKGELTAKNVINCTYSKINTINNFSGLQKLPLKHELTEMIYIEVPEEMRKIGVTLVDGPFFSILPYPGTESHTLSHVRFTPHSAWSDLVEEKDPDEILSNNKNNTQLNFILKDAVRYIPTLKKTKYKKSVFEIKTVLLNNEGNDGRPILFRKDYGFKNYHVILGGKIDNIYDITEVMEKAGII